MKTNHNIIFIGLMGSGKTTIGRKVAAILKYDFLDTDQEIERITGRSVMNIFKKEGELRFRSEETLALKRIVDLNRFVIATGGGIILKKENRDLLKKIGFIIYLKANTDAIVERVSRSNKRPLLQGTDLKFKVEELNRQRENLYEEIADLTIDTTSGSFENIVEEVIKAIKGKKK